jgi:cbb3-type cytochrome oxidase maturation protein
MEVLFMLIGFSLIVALLFLGCFIWAVRSGQYEDRCTPAIRMLFENTQAGSSSTSSSKTSEE